MTFQEVLEETVAILRRQGRVSYRALKRQFDVDDNFIDDLKIELTETLHLADDLEGKLLVWKAPLPAGRTAASMDEPSASGMARPGTRSSSEQRNLTVMFCDVVDATALAGRLDAEDLHAILRAYQEVVADVAERMGGYIAQYLGDGVLVYFGYPQAHEDDARRAVASGLEIIAGLAGLRAEVAAEHGETFGLRIGVHTGPALVGDVGGGGRQEQLAMGDTPNIAARVQALAAPDTVLVTAPVWRLAGGYFIGEAWGAQTLKGVPQSLDVYRVTEESGAQSRLDTARGGLTPLVGRDAETHLLLERWSQSMDGRGQVVMLSGEPGIGKSRLVLLLQEHVEQHGGARIAFRCSPYRSNSAFHPVIEQLTLRVGLEHNDSPEVKRAKLKRALEPFSFAREKVMPLLCRLLSVPLTDEPDDSQHLSPQQQRQVTQEVLAAWLFELAGRQPLLMVWEDLHWADPSTLSFLTLLMEQVPAARVLILLTFRPEFVMPWTGRSYCSHLTLDRLTGAQAEAMIAEVVRASGMPAEVTRQVVAKTDGVPLFIEELLKMIMESGLLREESGRYVLTGQLPSLAIPATLQDSLMARLDRLSSAREVAQLGAAIGREFSHDMIEAVAPMDAETLERGLAQLAEGEIIYRRGRAPSTTYVFKHALIRDAAYQSLVKSRRHFFHHQIARVLSERFPETVANEPELLAHHYAEAGLHEQAIVHWQRAAQRAIARSANTEGIAYLRRALDVLPLLPEAQARAQHELEIRVALGVPLIATRGYADAEVERCYSRARALSVQVKETPQLPNILWGLWVFYLCGGSLGDALAMGEQYRTAAEAHPEDAGQLLETCQLLGIAHFYRGEFESALPHLDQGGRLYDPALHHSLIFAHGGADTGVATLSHKALTLWALGYPERGRAAMRQAMDIAQRVAHPFSTAFAHYFRGWFLKLCREDDASSEAAGEALSICDKYGFPFWGLTSAVLRASSLAEPGGGLRERIAEMEAELAAYATIGGLLHRSAMRGLLAQAYAAAGDTGRALHELESTLAGLAGRDERWYEAELYRLQGEFLIAEAPANADRAESAFRRALDVAQVQGARAWALRAATSLVRLQMRLGTGEDGFRILATIHGTMTEGFDSADMRDARALLDTNTCEHSKPTEDRPCPF